MRIILFLAALLSAPAAFAQTLEDLHWMRGCWRTEAPRAAESGAVVTEVWLAPPMPAMLGYSYTMGEGEVQGWEQMRIEMIDGWPHFVAMPNGGAAVRFRLREMAIHVDEPAAEAVIFENPEHDYPQIVQYVLDLSNGALTATISRSDGTDAVTFEYRRIRCPANLKP
jgi:hypothetical protein